MRKQIVQVIDIIGEAKNQYNLKNESEFTHRAVNKAMHIVEGRWEIISFGIADVPSRKLRPYVKNTSHFKKLVEDWLMEGSDELRQCLLQKSHGRDEECKLINNFFDGHVISGDISRFIKSYESSHQKNCSYDDLINSEFGLSLSSKEYREGKIKFYFHMIKERNRKLIDDAKRFWKKQSDEQVRCSVCAFSFKEKYGEMGDGFIEAHHRQSISSLTKETRFRVEDLDPVCSNCHRMLHRQHPPLSVEKLRKKLRC